MEKHQIRGLFFEQLVKKLVTFSGYQKVSTGFVSGRGEKHQIDAFGKYGFTIPFIYPIRLICEAKWLKRGVHLNHVRDFEGVIKDISENYFTGKGIKGTDFTWRLLNRYCDCGAFFSATFFTDRAQHYAYAQGIFLVPYEKNSIFKEILRNIEGLINSNNQVFKKKFFNMAEDREKAHYSEKAKNIMERSPELKAMFSEIGAYLGMLDGVYPVHIITKRKLVFKYQQKDDYNIWIYKRGLDITETSLHFEFVDERNNFVEFTLPLVIGRSLVNVVREFYNRTAFSYIDIPVTLETEEGAYRRIFRASIAPESREIIHNRLSR